LLVNGCDTMAYRRWLTNCSNNLRLQSELVAEATGEITDSALPISCHIWYLADMIEHVAASEEENSDEAECGP